MQRLYCRLLLVALCLAPLNSAHGQWIEAYYDCLCSGNSQDFCARQTEENNTEFQRFLNQYLRHPQNSKESIAQIRSAQIILDQRRQIRYDEEGECLQYPLYIVRQAAFFAGQENASATPGSAIRISALRELSKQAYQWAEKHCFNQASSAQMQPILTLPNAMVCHEK